MNGKLTVRILVLNVNYQIEPFQQRSERRPGFFRPGSIETTVEARVGLL